MKSLYEQEHFVKRFQEIASCLLTQIPSEDIIHKWYFETEDISSYTLQDFCCVHDKTCWMTGISIIEAIETLIEEARDNTNLKENLDIN